MNWVLILCEDWEVRYRSRVWYRDLFIPTTGRETFAHLTEHGLFQILSINALCNFIALFHLGRGVLPEGGPMNRYRGKMVQHSNNFCCTTLAVQKSVPPDPWHCLPSHPSYPTWPVFSKSAVLAWNSPFAHAPHPRSMLLWSHSTDEHPKRPPTVIVTIRYLVVMIEVVKR